MSRDLAAKLQIKPGRSVRLVRVPTGIDLTLPAGATRRTRGTADVVLLFVSDLADLEARISGAAEATAEGGILWVCYPKTKATGGTDLNREGVWHGVRDVIGWRPVAQVAIDETWSALRFRPSR